LPDNYYQVKVTCLGVIINLSGKIGLLINGWVAGNVEPQFELWK